MNEENQATLAPVENMSSTNELEEVYIPNSTNTADDNELDDVIPCEPVTFEKQTIDYSIMDSSNDGFYDEVEAAPTVSLDQMVDIAPHVATENELEEEFIPEESTGDGLNDVA